MHTSTKTRPNELLKAQTLMLERVAGRQTLQDAAHLNEHFPRRFCALQLVHVQMKCKIASCFEIVLPVSSSAHAEGFHRF